MTTNAGEDVREEDLIEETEEEPDLEEEGDGDDEDVPAAAEPGEQVESSLEELLAKRTPEEKAAEEEEDESMLALERDDERVEPLAVRVVPQQPTEFVCKSCFLVKHRSQLADRRRMYCRDCA